MLRSRLSVVFVLNESRLINTVKFKNDRYLGDPINALKIFNEYNCDELIIFDKTQNQKINFELLEKLARSSRMPLCYGGSISNAQDAMRIFHLGFEKVSLNSAYSTHLAKEISSVIGSQSVIRTIDVRKSFFGNFIDSRGKDLVKVITETDPNLIGELIINCTYRDGTSDGMDTKLLSEVREHWQGPLTFTGGLKDLNESKSIFKRFGLMGIGATSVFVYKGALKGVLMSYPNIEDKRDITTL